VKTRLATELGAARAAEAAHAFLLDTLERCARVAARRIVVFAPSEARAEFASLVPAGYELIEQGSGDLGERLAQFFGAQAEGTHVVVLGADSPTLPLDYVEQAFALLGQYEAVLGPATDGGYYLLGSRGLLAEAFADIPWSTPHVLEATVAQLQRRGRSLALLPPWYDVDTVEDWHFLRGHVRALQLAGAALKSPRTEQLLAAWGPSS
jgi:rSAM/selenodomain-associated transferase 1